MLALDAPAGASPGQSEDSLGYPKAALIQLPKRLPCTARGNERRLRVGLMTSNNRTLTEL